jgi:hypothetical protein
MKILETMQESACLDTLDDAVLSYQCEQAGFAINLMKRSVLLFNKVLNSTFIYPYSNIMEINYSLPDCRSDDAEICIITDDALNPVWTFRVPSNANGICEQWVEVFNNHIFFCPEEKINDRKQNI